MKKTFICSLCRNGIIGGALYLDESTLTFRTNKLTVDRAYRNLVMPIGEIESVSYKQILFWIATLRMKNGAEYSFLIFNKNRFHNCLAEITTIESRN